MASLNESLTGFPTHQGTVAGATLVIVAAGLSLVGRLVFRGEALPDAFWYFYGALSGVSVGGLAVKRFSDYGLNAIKGGESIENVAAAQQITKTGTYPVPVAAPAAPVMPAAGVQPTNAAIVAALETAAQGALDPNEPDGTLGAAR